ncbi:MAG TPA: 3-hydroxyacyl-CoA dehydrogenase NAD-binding domain-containing protein [Magnetospirillaceae bacterium]|jgi:3-hydroxyacyl-CoA dehydrogenase
MAETSSAVSLTIDGSIALITLNNPPVNALGFALREGLVNALNGLRDNKLLTAVVLAGSERAFSAGADISEFGKPPREPHLLHVIEVVESFPIPVVAAIRGVAMGGGLELALGCHYRVGWSDAKLALPEIKLGLLPGAGGTQRLPRLIGYGPALEFIMTGDNIPVAQAKTLGLLDHVADGAFPTAAVTWAKTLPAGNTPKIRDRADHLSTIKADPGKLDQVAKPLIGKSRAPAAARACVEAVKAAMSVPFDEGMALERKLFIELLGSEESKALRYTFFAEREAAKVPGLTKDTQPRKIGRAGVIGAGTMGGGIAMCFANAGIPVTLIETDAGALERGIGKIASTYQTSVKRGSLSEEQMKRRLALIEGKTEMEALASADMIVEAVFEEMDLKLQIFGKLDGIAKPGAVLASNTSYLDVDKIATATKRPDEVLGTHFFSPANVMRLVEVVRGKKTSPEALATAIAISKSLGKMPVVVGVCDGFVGNRMLAKRSVQAERLLLEGALPHQVDEVLVDFGFRMGPFAMGDLAGLDVGWRARKARNLKAPVGDALCEAGRFGQKTGKGYYVYGGADGRTAMPDPEVEALIRATSEKEGFAWRQISQKEILERLLYPMINEGARILEEGIAARASDIDIIWLNGYGWPAAKGGPMYYADRVGLAEVAARLDAFAAATGDATLKPAPLLAKLAGAGQSFASLSAPAAA